MKRGAKDVVGSEAQSAPRFELDVARETPLESYDGAEAALMSYDQ